MSYSKSKWFRMQIALTSEEQDELEKFAKKHQASRVRVVRLALRKFLDITPKP